MTLGRKPTAPKCLNPNCNRKVYWNKVTYPAGYCTYKCYAETMAINRGDHL